MGVIAAAGLSFVVPGRYVSSALLRATPPKGGGCRQASQQVGMMQQELLSRSSLAELIQRRSLDLYRGERQRMPMQDIIERMRRDIQIRRVPGAEGNGSTLSVSFAYPNRFKALAVARALTTRFVEGNQVMNWNRANIWQQAWHEKAPAGRAWK